MLRLIKIFFLFQFILISAGASACTYCANNFQAGDPREVQIAKIVGTKNGLPMGDQISNDNIIYVSDALQLVNGKWITQTATVNVAEPVYYYQYLADVVWSEIGQVNIEAMKAQGIASFTKMVNNRSLDADNDYEITGTVYAQAYRSYEQLINALQASSSTGQKPLDFFNNTLIPICRTPLLANKAG
jgi:hypothetical protein